MEEGIMQKMKWLAGAAMMMAGAVYADLVTIVIDRAYNSGNNIAEYSAEDRSNPWDGTATVGTGVFKGGTTVGVAVDGKRNYRPAFFFEIPTGTTSAQVSNATLRVRLDGKVGPTTDLSIYSAALDTLGTKDATYAISMYSDASFTDTGLGLTSAAATGIIHTFDVTSLVKAALDEDLSTTVVAFRFQMDDDTLLAYGVNNNYVLIGFDTATIENRPALTLEVIPEPATLGLFSVTAGILLFFRRRFL